MVASSCYFRTGALSSISAGTAAFKAAFRVIFGPDTFAIFAPIKWDNSFTRSDSLRTSFLELFVSELIDKIEGLVRRPAAVAPQDPFAEDPAPVAEASPAVSSDQSATPNRTLLIHGYSASGVEFQKWKDALGKADIDTATIEIGNYVSLNNEITIKDLGEEIGR